MKLTVVLNADASGLVGTLRVGEAELRKLGGQLDRTAEGGGKADAGLRKASDGARGFSNSATMAARSLNTLNGLLATLGVTYVTTQLIQAGMAMDRFRVSLAAATGSQAAGAESMAFLRGEAQRLGLYLPTLAQGFAGLAAATRGTALEGEATRKIFSAVAEAGRAMNLTNDQIMGTMNALQQMAGKGTVSMEELRQQLGDRLPGAMQVAARAMDMTVSELVKLVSEGKIASDEFLPKFAAELSRASAAGVLFAQNSPAAEFNRLKTALFELAGEISDGGVLEALADQARSLASSIRSLSDSGALSALGAGIGVLIRNVDTLVVSIGGLYALRLVTTLFDDTVGAARRAIAAYTDLGLKINTVATAKKVLRQQGAALFAAMGGWPMVIAATIGGLYAFYSALQDAERKARSTALAAKELSDRLEELARQKALVASGVPEELVEETTSYQKMAAEVAGLTQRIAALQAQLGTGTREGSDIAGLAQIEVLRERLSFTQNEMARLAVAVGKNSTDIIGDFRAMAGDSGKSLADLADQAVETARWLGEVFGLAARNAASDAAKLDDETQKFIDKLKEERETLGLSRAELILHTAAKKAAAKETEAAAAKTDASRTALLAAADAIRNEAKLTAASITNHEASTKAKAAATRATENATKAADDYIKKLREEVATAAMSAEQLERYERSKLNLTKEQEAEAERLNQTLRTLQEAWAALTATLEPAYDALAELTRGSADLEEQLAQGRDVLAGLDDAQIRYNASVREANRLAMEALALGPMTAEQQAQLEQRLRLLAELRDQDRAIEQMQELGQEAARAAEDSARSWEDFTGGLADAILDGSKGVKRWWKAMLDDMKRQLIQSGLLRLFGSLFNIGGAQSGGVMSMFGSMMGGGGIMGGAAGGAGGGIMSAGSWVQAGQNLWSGFGQGMQAMPMVQSLLGGLSNIGAMGNLISYNGASMAAINAGMGAGGVGPSSALAGSGSTSGFGLTGAGAGVAAMAAWFAAAIIGNLEMWNRGWRPDGESLSLPNGQSVHGGGRGSATDSFGSMLGAGGIIVTRVAESILGSLGFSDKWASVLSGGSLVTRMFGRKAPELRQAEANYMFSGSGGLSGNERYFTHEQGGLFRSSRQTWHEFDQTGEVLEAGQAMWAQLLQTMTAAAAQMGSEVPDSFAASFRHWQQLSGKTGEVEAEKFIVEMLGRTWEEATADAAIIRLNAEALIATIDAALGTTVQQAIGQALPGPIVGGVGDALDRVGRMIDAQIEDSIGGMGWAGPATGGAGGTMGEASAIAERWRHDAELLAAGAQFLLAAATDIRRGVGLLGEEGGLTAITALIEDLQGPSESLVDTYVRVATSAALLDQALALSGVQIDGTREHIVRLATAITDAAGGLERATALWNSYFSNFYSAAELAAFQSQQLRTAAEAAFSAAGLNLDDYTHDLAAFRAAFEAALPTLSAEEIANWLAAADALAAVTATARAIDASIADGAWQQYLDGLTDSQRAVAELTKHYDDWRESLIAAGATSEQLAAVEDQRAVALERLLAAAEAEYQSQVGNVRDMVDARGMSEFALEMRDIDRWAQQTTDALNAAAVAAGRQYAAEEDLALVHAETAARAAEAIAKLRASAAALVAELFGPAAGSLDDINARIAEIEARSAGSFGAVESGIGNAVDAWIAGIARVQDFLDSILLSAELSTLTPEQMLAEAQGQFDTLLAAARGGDADALSALPDAARTLLELGRDFWSSGDQYQQLFDTTRDALQTVAGMAGPAATGSEVGYYGGGHSAVSGELAELYAQRDALLAEQEAAQRAEMIESLGGMIRELIQATGEPLAEVAASIGLNLTELAESLGIDLNDVSVATATGLVDMARLLGVDVAELAQNVGISLGSLADDQSLLNQALQGEIDKLPEGQRDALQEYFNNIVTATNEADANAAIGTMSGYINTLDADIRDKLSPFFDDIDPTPVVTELTRLSDLAATAGRQLDAAREANEFLRRIAENNYAANTAAGLPAYATGGWVNGPTALLAGEAGRELILPNPVSEFFARHGIPVNSGGGDPALVRELIAEIRQLRAERVAGDREVAAAARGAGDKVAGKIDSQTEADDRRIRELIAATERSNR